MFILTPFILHLDIIYSCTVLYISYHIIIIIIIIGRLKIYIAFTFFRI